MTLDNSSDRTEASVTPSAYRSGLILAAFSIVFTLIVYFTGNITNNWANWISVPFVLFIIYYYQKNFRDSQQNGFITFGKAWKYGFIMSAISTVFSAIMTFVLYKSDDSLVDAALEKAYEDMMDQGMTSAQVDQAMSITEKMVSPEAMIIWVLVFGLIFSLIWPLITSAIVQRKHPLD